MNKSEFVSELYSKSGLTKQECKACLNAMIAVIQDTLRSGECVTISNFGKFKIQNVKPKSLYNFKSKKMELVDGKSIPTFKASESLKRNVK